MYGFFFNHPQEGTELISVKRAFATITDLSEKGLCDKLQKASL